MAETAKRRKRIAPISPLRKLRIDRQMSLTNVANELVMAPHSLSRIETGLIRLPGDRIIEMAQLYKVPISTIVRAAYYGS